MSKAGHTGQHNDFSPSVQIHWQPHSFSLISLTLKIVFLLAKNNLGVLKKKKKVIGNRVLFPKCKAKS